MFRGSIPADMCRIVREHVSLWTGVDHVYNACCGNFTVERTIATLGKQLHSCDVLLYSTAIGRYYTGDPLDLPLSQLAHDEFPWLAQYHTGPSQQLATVLLGTRLAPMMGKSNPYWDKMRGAHELHWPTLLTKTVAKIEAAAGTFHLASYDAEDAMTWIDRIPDTAGVVTYPPFHGASTAFARDFAKLETMFQWEPPPFQPLGDDELARFTERVTGRDYWLLGTNEQIPDLAEHLRGRTRTTNRGVPIYVYAKSGPTRLVQPHQKTEVWPGRHLSEEDIGDRPSLVVLSHGQFVALRSAYMNANIRPGSESIALALLVDGLLCGVFAYSWAPTKSSWQTHLPQQPTVYMLSDFPVSTSRYAKLSKLIVMAAVSADAQALTWRHGHRRYQSIVTTAYAKRPVSMKYRGVLRLLKREENTALEQDWSAGMSPTDSYYAQRYELQYGGPFTGRALTDVLTDWKRRYGKDLRR